MKKIIVITGSSCTGKTTIGRKLEERMGVAMISKDEIKEKLFDKLGWKDRAWSKKIDRLSYWLMRMRIRRIMKSKKKLIIESDFEAGKQDKWIKKMAEKYGYKIVQILCWAKGEILVKRFKQRTKLGKRHSGHVDEVTFGEIEADLRRGKRKALNVGGKLIEVNSSDWEKIDWKWLRKAVISD